MSHPDYLRACLSSSGFEEIEIYPFFNSGWAVLCSNLHRKILYFLYILKDSFLESCCIVGLPELNVLELLKN
ncbi:hypothetical protein LEP1GSC188_0840 [Leptospira weilii serovar Topaz str. LT2116]|uniref:Uncharacterized protein n=1 Tax=Leptospira weilii serovar Topaz str. LT2116 TaxID=1088540 RepID=M3FNA7_9LEPT|nr:hypothetical protein LEP1GSC188_0840 [Leptospira weilii serovar Topaz str. LT2116]